MQLGVGIGAGILIGGEVYRGATGAAGEIGYLPLGDAPRPAGGSARALRAAAGGRAFARLGREAAAAPEAGAPAELAGGDPHAVDAEIVFAAAARGDAGGERRSSRSSARRSPRGIAAVGRRARSRVR